MAQSRVFATGGFARVLQLFIIIIASANGDKNLNVEYELILPCTPFFCSSGDQPSDVKWICDGAFDCKDMSDEMGCFEKVYYVRQDGTYYMDELVCRQKDDKTTCKEMCRCPNNISYDYHIIDKPNNSTVSFSSKCREKCQEGNSNGAEGDSKNFLTSTQAVQTERDDEQTVNCEKKPPGKNIPDLKNSASRFVFPGVLVLLIALTHY